MAETDLSTTSRAEEHSQSGTFGHEASLPRVPLPELATSGAKLLEWCAPGVSDADLAQTESALATLRDSAETGERLQDTLHDYDATTGVGSWLDRFWEFRYLARRDRVAGNGNFFLLLPDAATHRTVQPQLDRATQLVEAAVAHKLALDRGTLPVDRHEGEPLSMAQHPYLFGTTRIPGFAEDTVRGPHRADDQTDTPPRHIVVFRRGNIFSVEVIADDGRAHSHAEIAAALRSVVDRGNDTPAAGTKVGALTARERAQWAASRQGLLAHDEANADALDTVESALLCLCLDDVTPEGPEHACAELMHGQPGNRWFDKSVSLVVFADGSAGINAEMSCVDVATVTSFVDALYDADIDRDTRTEDPAAGHPAAGHSPGHTPTVRAVEFRLDEALRANVRTAAAEFSDHVADVTSRAVRVDDCGSTRIRALGIEPDAFLQLAYQLAHQRSHGRVPATYEPIGMRHYRNGRTAAMRPVTAESVHFVNTMDDQRSSPAARREALRAAAEKHNERIAECHAGGAPEQHLWELQRIARQQGRKMGIYEVPQLYESPGWTTMRADELSVRSTSSPHADYLGSGPADGPGIGAAHVLTPDTVRVHLSAPSRVADELDTLGDEFVRAVAELRELLAGS